MDSDLSEGTARIRRMLRIVLRRLPMSTTLVAYTHVRNTKCVFWDAKLLHLLHVSNTCGTCGVHIISSLVHKIVERFYPMRAEYRNKKLSWLTLCVRFWNLNDSKDRS